MDTPFLLGLRALRQRLDSNSQARAGERNAALSFLRDAEDGKASVMPVLFPLVFDADTQVAQEAVAAIVRLTLDFSAAQWRWLELRMRSYAGVTLSGMPTVMSSRLRALNRYPEQITLLGVASFSRSGYVREAAVGELAQNKQGDELPFLLMRLNDWVQEVSRAAHDACTSRLIPEYAPHYVSALPYVEGLGRSERRDLAPFIQSVETLLTRPGCRAALETGCDAAESVTRRTCFRLALSTAGEEAAPLFQKAFLSHDSVVRRGAARLLRDRPAGDFVQKFFLSRLSHDSLASIRREYLYLCHEKYPERAAWALRNALLDPHPSVRSVARYYLQVREPMDFRLFYRAALETPASSSRAQALAGLGEVGQAEDAARVKEFLHTSSSDLRQAAVTALERLDGDESVPQLLNTLSDVRSRVSRAAREALLPRVNLVEDDALWRVFTQADTPHAQRNALRLMFALSKWRGGVLLIKSCEWASGQESEAVVTAVALLKRWVARSNSSALRPTREQITEIHQRVGDCRFILDPITFKELREIVRHWERLAE